eukprot:scaffold698_cov333-Pavlova_lutheri.AAC.12
MDVHSASHIARRLSATPLGGFCSSGRCVSVLGNSTLRLATNHMRDLVVNAYSPRKRSWTTIDQHVELTV